MDYLKLMKSKKPYAVVYNEMPVKLQQKSYHLCWKYNLTNPSNVKLRHQILNQLFHSKSKVMVNSPFHSDYGFNIRFKGFAFLNYGCVILDTSPVIIGNGAMIAPHVVIACSGHPINYKQRNKGVMISKPVVMGNHVWIGANTFINGGVKIGDHSVIGAGSTVTRNIPANVVAFGSPCRARRKITKQDLINHIY